MEIYETSIEQDKAILNFLETQMHYYPSEKDKFNRLISITLSAIEQKRKYYYNFNVYDLIASLESINNTRSIDSIKLRVYSINTGKELLSVNLKESKVYDTKFLTYRLLDVECASWDVCGELFFISYSARINA